MLFRQRSNKSFLNSSLSPAIPASSATLYIACKKLSGHLNENNLRLYNSLKSTEKKGGRKRSSSIFEHTKPFIMIKQTENMAVFVYRNSVFKLKNVHYERYRHEIFFTRAFYEEAIKTLLSEDGYLMILPKFNRPLFHYKYFSEDQFTNLKADLVKQVLNFHRNSCVHNDINENNIVKIKKDDAINWKIIDFSKMMRITSREKEDEEIVLQTNSGDMKLVPKYAIESCENDLFWMFMKDWKSLVYIINGFLEEIHVDIIELQYSYEEKDRSRILKIIETIASQFNQRVPDIYYKL